MGDSLAAIIVCYYDDDGDNGDDCEDGGDGSFLPIWHRSSPFVTFPSFPPHDRLSTPPLFGGVVGHDTTTFVLYRTCNPVKKYVHFGMNDNA